MACGALNLCEIQEAIRSWNGDASHARRYVDLHCGWEPPPQYICIFTVWSHASNQFYQQIIHRIRRPMSEPKYPPISYCGSEKGNSYLLHECSYFHCLWNPYLSLCNVFVLEPQDNPLCCCMEWLFGPRRSSEHVGTMHKYWISVRSYVFSSLLVLAVPINSIGDHFTSPDRGPRYKLQMGHRQLCSILPQRDLIIRFPRPAC